MPSDGQVHPPPRLGQLACDLLTDGPAPTTRTAPGRNCAALRYALVCSAGTGSGIDGTFGTPSSPVATTTSSASHVPAVLVTSQPSSVARSPSTATPSRTGAANDRA